MISVLEDWFAAQNWLTPVPTSGSSMPDKLYYCRFESQRVKKKSSTEHKLATPARKRPKRKTTTSRIIQEETGLSRPPAIATSTFSINAPATTASTYTQNTVQLTPNTDSRVQAMASSPSDENHRVRVSFAPSTHALLISLSSGFNDSRCWYGRPSWAELVRWLHLQQKPWLHQMRRSSYLWCESTSYFSFLICSVSHRNTRDLQMAADKAGDAFGETLDSAVTTKVCDTLPLLSTLQCCTNYFLLLLSRLHDVVHLFAVHTHLFNSLRVVLLRTT